MVLCLFECHASHAAIKHCICTVVGAVSKLSITYIRCDFFRLNYLLRFGGGKSGAVVGLENRDEIRCNQFVPGVTVLHKVLNLKLARVPKVGQNSYQPFLPAYIS